MRLMNGSLAHLEWFLGRRHVLLEISESSVSTTNSSLHRCLVESYVVVSFVGTSPTGLLTLFGLIMRYTGRGIARHPVVPCTHLHLVGHVDAA